MLRLVLHFENRLSENYRQEIPLINRQAGFFLIIRAALLITPLASHEIFYIFTAIEARNQEISKQEIRGQDNQIKG